MDQSTSIWKPKILAVVYLAVRYYAAFTLLTYGFAKIMGAQFTILDSQLAKPMGEVSGFWLTWYYFGVSPIYSGIVAGTQIAGAYLMCFRRTALLGTLLLLPVMINIVSIDHWVIGWGLDADPLRVALYVLFSLLVVLTFHAKDLLRFFLKQRDELALFPTFRWWMIAAQIVVVTGILVYTAHHAYYLANVNNRAPTAIDGAWQLIHAQPARSDLPEWFYFEYNRAYMAVLKFPDGKTVTHDFRVNPEDKTIQIGKEWLSPGSDVFSGKWMRTGDQLTIEGAWAATPPLRMTLQRKKMPVKDHR